MRRVSRTKGLMAPLALVACFGLASFSVADEPAAHDREQGSAPSGAKTGSPEAAGVLHHMQAMHEKMLAAKTPAERQALMAEHMNSMQEGMAMMQQMAGPHGGGAASSQMMQMRMNMMTMMMQMMIDRQQMNSGMPMMGAAPDKPGK